MSLDSGRRTLITIQGEQSVLIVSLHSDSAKKWRMSQM